MEPGENEQARFCGKPEHAKAIALLKDPELGAAVTVTFPEPPEEIVNAEGLVPNVKLVAPLEVVPPPVVVAPPAPVVVAPPPVVLVRQLAENFTGPDMWFVMLGFPTACTYSV